MEPKNLPAAQEFSPEKMKKVNLFETTRFFCDLYCFEPGQTQKPHTHAGSDKVYIVLEGTGQFQIGGEEKQLTTGTIVLAPAGVEHGVVNPGNGRLVLLVFMAPNPAD